MTPAQTKRLAREARKLAMECLTNGPQMVNQWCGCAIGICMKRARLWRGRTRKARNESEELAVAIDDMLSDDSEEGFGIVSIAVRERIWTNNPTAVVFPLLALADVLDEQPRDAATAAPKSTP